MVASIREILKKVWGYDSFRPLQEDIVQAALKGKDVLALMPTGGGKSICFQVPALAREGVCIVITPLIALMKDQVEQLRHRGISAIAIYSGMNRREIDIALDNCVYGSVKFLYVSPERLQTELLQERIKRMKVSFLVVDEAHCISQWGYDFRPPYLQIADFRQLIPDANIIALTATATPEVKEDIQEKLAFREERVVFQKSFARENLSYAVRTVEDKEGKMFDILSKVSGTAIVYVRSRQRAEVLAMRLKKLGFSAGFYHAGLSAEVRSQRQEDWIQNKTRIIVATNAFGMGIDKPDVRLVIHMDLPDTLEAYYQEAGRGGRDEKKAYAVVLCNDSDVEALRGRINRSYPSLDLLKRVYQSLANFYKIAVGSSLLASYDFDLDHFCNTYQLSKSEAYYAIKKLEEEGLIQLNESFFQPSKVHFIVDNQQLYEFQIANEAYDPLVKTLMRMFGGEAFSGYCQVNEKQLAYYLSVPVSEVKYKLAQLDKFEIINYFPQKDQPQLTFVTPRFDVSRLPLDRKKLEAKHQQDLVKAEAVIRYMTNNIQCRTQGLLEYFGELTDEKCGVCDVCVKEKRKKNVPQQEIYRIKVLKQLACKALEPEALYQALNAKSEEELTDLLRDMLEKQELRYDEQGRLTIHKLV